METVEDDVFELIDLNRNFFENDKHTTETPKSKNVVVKREKVTYADDIRLDSDTTDITLIVNNQKINAHKEVLVSNSQYFDCMFTSCFKERDQDKIEINITDVSYETLKTLIEFFYKLELIITDENVQDLLIGANILLLEDVSEACVEYLKTMIDIENCISMKDFADSLSLNDLYSLCLTFMTNNFRYVADSEMFLTISYDELLLLVKDENLYAKEEMVYDVVMKWIKHKPLIRSKYSTDLLWYVRLPLVLNTYQGVTKLQEFQGAKINGLSSFRMEYRKPFRKGILILSQYHSSPEWYDVGLDQWLHCNCENCHCENYQMVLGLPRPLCSCAVLEDGRLFAVGGLVGARGLKLVNVFDSKKKVWDSLPDMVYARIRPYIIQLGKKVFVIGGCAEFKNNLSRRIGTNMEYYDLESNEWVTIRYSVNGISFQRNDTFITSSNGLIYIIGNYKSGIYDPSGCPWSAIPELPEKRQNAAICSLNGRIYIIGGYHHNKYLKSVWAYCTDTKEWVSIADMNSPRSQPGVVVMNDFIYVFGGKSNHESCSNTFEVYSPYENKWNISVAVMNKKHGQCDIDAVVIDKNSKLFKGVFEDVANNVSH